MTDPLRRDPTEFLRTLKKMTSQSSWQKCLLFASKGRMIGFKLGIQHYNTILFSQCLWGRALEIVQVIRAMEEDDIKPNGVSYYYICNGMANADHGMNCGFNMNFALGGLQHWRVASNALMACEHNGYDPSDSMYNSCIISCTIPVMNQWKHAAKIFQKMVEEERTPHPQMIEFFVQCLVRNHRPEEANALLRYAADNNVKGYEEKGKDLADVFKNVEGWKESQHSDQFAARGNNNNKNVVSDELIRKLVERTRQRKLEQQQQQGLKQLSSSSSASLKITEEEKQDILRQIRAEKESDTEKNIETENELEVLHPQTGGYHHDETKEFRPRVYRGLWWKWHAIANRYRPTETLHRRQIAPKNSPSGIPGFNRM